jgi:hypothetical protein
MDIIKEVREGLYTEVDDIRCTHLLDVLHSIAEEKIPGDLVETGIYKGGTAIIMSWANIEFKMKKNLWCFDSFRGCPDPTTTKFGAHKDEVHSKGNFSCDLPTVVKNFEKFKVLTPDVIFVEGWFQDTMQKYYSTEGIALLRFDGDLYSSTLEVLEVLYPKVVPGGYVIIDDYCLEPCRAAVHEYLDSNNIQVKILPPKGTEDSCGSWWRKP